MNDCVATIHSSDRRSNREANRVETDALMPLRAAFGAVWLLALVFAVGARAVTEIDCELSGHVNVESRWFPEAGAHLGQRSHASGFVAASKLYLEDAAGRSLTLAPFFATTTQIHAAPMPICAKPICCYSAKLAMANGSCAWASIRCSGASPNRSTWSISSTKSISSNIRPERPS